MLSPEGKCKTFDAHADGFARGEGCGSVVVKRLSRAHADGDRILAVLASTATNQDGRSAGLTAPNGPSQEAVIHTALRAAGLKPADIAYIESHGTATKLGDGIEWAALSNVFGGRNGQQPLYVGSAKANVGHLEGASGLVGLIKAIMILRTRKVPAQANFKTMNPLFDTKCGLSVPSRLEYLHDRSAATPLACGISSFGFGGTNAHAIVRLPTLEEIGHAAGSHQENLPWPFERRYFSWRPSDSPLITHKSTRNGGREVVYSVVLGQRLRQNLLDDHKVRDAAVVPAAVILEMLRAALEAHFQGDDEFTASVILDEIVFVKPATLSVEISPVQLLQCSAAQVVGRPQRMEWKVETESQGVATVHAVANFIHHGGSASHGLEDALDVEDASMMHSTLIKPAEFYQRLAARGLSYGPTFAILTRIAVNRDRSSAFLKIGGASTPPEASGPFKPARSEYFVPPQLCDAAFQACSLLHRDAEDKTFMPFQMSQVRWHITDTKNLSRKPKYAVARRLEGTNSGLLVAAVDVYDQKGLPLLTIGHFVAKELSGSTGKDAMTREPASSSTGLVARTQTQPSIMRCSNTKGVLSRETLQPISRSRLDGGNISSRDIIDSMVIIQPQIPTSLASKLALQLARLPIQHIDLQPSSSLHTRLSALHGIQGVLLTPSRLAEQPWTACLEVLDVVKALDNMPSPPPLYVLAMETNGPEESRVPDDSWALSGLVRACRVEYPDLRIFLWRLDESLLNDRDDGGYFMTTGAAQVISKLLPVEQEVATDTNGHYGKILKSLLIPPLRTQP